MRNEQEMKRIETAMQGSDVIEIHRHAAGRNYWLNGECLNGQIVNDMIADGWLVEGDSSLRLAA